MFRNTENDCILHIIEGTESKKCFTKLSFFFTRMQKSCPRYKYTQNASLFTVAPYILNNLLIHQNWENHCIMKKHPTTTTIWHQTNTMILFGSKMNWLHLRIGFCEIWQKYLVITVKIMKIHKSQIYLQNIRN